MVQLKQSDRIREIVVERYVRPALQAGESHFSIPAREVLKLAESSEGFPRGRTPLVCEVLQGKKLLDQSGLEIERVEGPPSKQSRRVVVHYRVLHNLSRGEVTAEPAVKEDSAAWAKRLTDKLRGLLKEELAEYGGAEGFMKWVRSDDDEDIV